MPSQEPKATEPTDENVGVFLSKRTRKEAPFAPRVARGVTLLRRRRLRKGKDEPRPTWRLKNTGEASEISEARRDAEHIRRLSEADPGLFRALQDLVEGRDRDVSRQQRRALREEWLLLGRDLAPHPWVTSIMKAALRRVPDGPCVVDPLDVRTAEDAAHIQRVENEARRRSEEWMVRCYKKLTRRPGRDDEPKGDPSR